MAVPKFEAFFNAVLASLQDGIPHSYKECREYVKRQMNLTEADLHESLPSGRQFRWINRVYWCSTYLQKAGLLVRPQKSYLQITPDGKALLDENVKITVNLMKERYPAFAAFQSNDASSDNSAHHITHDSMNEETPQETFERVYKEINSGLADELLTTVGDL